MISTEPGGKTEEKGLMKMGERMEGEKGGEEGEIIGKEKTGPVSERRERWWTRGGVPGKEKCWRR